MYTASYPSLDSLGGKGRGMGPQNHQNCVFSKEVNKQAHERHTGYVRIEKQEGQGTECTGGS